MINFGKISNVNGLQLITELENAGINLTANEVGSKNPFIDNDGNLWLRIQIENENDAKIIVENHTPADEA